MDVKLFDIVCTLPLTSDLITLASHPTEPLFVVGLASGHLQAFRLPTTSKADTDTPTKLSNGMSAPPSSRKRAHSAVTFSDQVTSTPQKSSTQRPRPRRSNLHRDPSSPNPASGYGMVETIWKTRRHKGSCRAVAFSPDGRTLFSAGTDGIIKAADSMTGQVVGKALLPGKKSGKAKSKLGTGMQPSQLLVLNPQCVVLGDDEGGVHEYELQPVAFNIRKVNGETVNGEHRDQKETRLAPASPQPKRTHNPHRTQDNPTAADPVTSLTALPPSSASTSGFSRAWISTAGCTLAVCDIYKGFVSCSEEQIGGGERWELQCSACLAKPTSQDPPTPSTETKKSANGKQDDDQVTILVGDSSSGVAIWPRGQFDTRTGYRRLRRNAPVAGIPLEDYSVDSIAVAPISEQDPEPLIVVGLATGVLHFLRAGAKKRLMESAVAHVHDDRGLDGCIAIVFDAEGRMITGGGNLLKVWHREQQNVELDELDSEQIVNGALDSEEEDDSDLPRKRSASEGNVSDSEDEEEDSSEEVEKIKPPPKKRAKRGKNTAAGRNKVLSDGRGDNGIMKFTFS